VKNNSPVSKPIFTQLASCYSSNNYIIEQLWNEIETAYSNPKRHYHTLHHLQHLIDELSTIKEAIQDWNTILFSVFYHDLVYNPLRRDNEERSVLIMENRLQSLDVPITVTDTCKAQILATKAHSLSADTDTNYFTDADLSILGQQWNTYKEYAAAIRKEYALYPDPLYKPGRIAVLNHFLKMDPIFKTEPFFTKYENQARQNLLQELQELQYHN
jgi:predicted metal-dependent HD superfamily phosphohydrolase